MDVQFPAELELKLTRAAEQRGREPASLVQEAVERLLDYDAWFAREVAKGISAADRNEFADHEDVAKLIDRRYRG